MEYYFRHILPLFLPLHKKVINFTGIMYFFGDERLYVTNPEICRLKLEDSLSFTLIEEKSSACC